jgi:hypothetical protein
VKQQCREGWVGYSCKAILQYRTPRGIVARDGQPVPQPLAALTIKFIHAHERKQQQHRKAHRMHIKRVFPFWQIYARAAKNFSRRLASGCVLILDPKILSVLVQDEQARAGRGRGQKGDGTSREKVALVRYGMECSSERARASGRTGGFLWVDGGYVSELKPLSPISRVKSKYNDGPTHHHRLHTHAAAVHPADSRQKLAKLKFTCTKSIPAFFASLVFWGCIMNLGSPQKHFPSFLFWPNHRQGKNQYKRRARSLTFNISTMNQNFHHFRYTVKSFIWLGNEREKENKSAAREFLCVFN